MWANGRPNVEKARDKAISLKSDVERDLVRVELEKKTTEDEFNSLCQKNTYLVVEFNWVRESSIKDVESVKGWK